MIQIQDKEQCCGCNVCGDICPTQAISFKTDNEGFWYPTVDLHTCVDCHLCEKVCPIINVDQYKNNSKYEPICYAANHKNLEIRFDSTSGGVFSALAEEIYKQNGYVGGAIYNEDFSAKHYISNNKEDLKKIRSSKYLQSNAESFYKQVKDICDTGSMVLVCGTPCQMVALRSFLPKDYENLIIVDFICHSIASPKAHRRYFDYLEETYASKAIYFKAKNKELGWRALCKKTIFANGKSHYGTVGKDYYSRAYHSNMIDRPSCYSCKFKGYPRIADITLADFWDKKQVAKELDDNIGTSAVIINTPKGKKIFDLVTKKLQKQEISIKDIEPSNPALLYSTPKPNYNRDEFFRDLDNLRFDALGDKYFPIKPVRHAKLRVIKTILKQFKEMTQLHPVAMWQFFKLNFFHPAIHTNWKKEALIYPSPYCIFEISKEANIIVNGPVRIGRKKFKKSRLETRILVDKGGKLEFQGPIRIGYGGDIEVFKNAELVFGADSGGNIGLTLICGNKIHIGSHTFYGRNVSIRDTNGGHIIAQQGFKNTNPVIIGDFCWLCSDCTIMPGVKIGDGTIVGANSVVVTPLPARVLVTGSPAKIIDTDITWKH